ncbi:MAG: pyridoxal phosphate-dependent aminotransferase [Nitrospinae bacterium]|nr:pyridoxal phosphate-dependent aminotransferase [Nitrospinota bacterium]
MFSQRSQEITPFYVMELLEKAKELEKEGRNIIHLEVGEPNHDTPEVIKNAAIKAIKDNKTKYTHSQGLLELREAIAENYYQSYGVTISPERIIVTSGTSNALFLIFSLLLENKREVIIPKPYYACYPNYIRFLDGIPMTFDISEKNNYQYELPKIKEKINDHTAALLINSPSNPTGAIQSKEVFENLAELNIPIISDEIYQGLVYDEVSHSVLEFNSEAFIINGFSKLHAMTGWRLGYLIAPENAIRPMQKIQQNFYISANEFVQWAGIAALKNEKSFIPDMVQEYKERRDIALKSLKEIGLNISYTPQGAYYILIDVSRYTDDSMAFALDILQKTGVAVTPGLDFGVNDHIRITYANSKENLRAGIKKLGDYLASY